MRVGIDASNLRRGGGRTHLIELIQAAEPNRDMFDELVVWGTQETLDLLVCKPWLKKISVTQLEKGLFKRSLWQRFSLGNAARKKGCNVLMVPGGNFSSNFSPVVTMSQNMLPFEWKELRRYGFSLMTLKLILLRHVQSRSFRLADGVIFLTNYAKKNILLATGPISNQKIVIPHGISKRFFMPKDTQSDRKFSSDDKIINLIYVSIIDQYKHQWHVVEGVAKAREKTGLNLQLILVGPSYPSALKKLNKAIDLFDSNSLWIQYKGAIDYQQLHSLYAESQIGIFASSCENLPIILLETMAAGLPIACSDRGPMPEVLEDAGLYFDPEKPDSLCDVLIDLLVSEERMRQLSTASFKKAQEYSWARCAEQTFGFLRSVVTAAKNKKNNTDVFQIYDKI